LLGQAGEVHVPRAVDVEMRRELGVLEVISEVSEAGTVNAVFVTNRGDAPVLILDGDEFWTTALSCT